MSNTDLYDYFNDSYENDMDTINKKLENTDKSSVIEINEIESEPKTNAVIEDEDNFDSVDNYNDYEDNSEDSENEETEYEEYDNEYVSPVKKAITIVSYVALFFLAAVGAITLITPNLRETLLSLF